jgi:hypothetical protein
MELLNRTMHLPSGTALGVVATTVLALAAQLSGQTPAPKGVSRAYVFLNAFGPTSNETGLRASRITDEMQVVSAFHAIDVLQAEMAAGKWSEHEGKEQIERWEDVIRTYADDRAKEALDVAGKGRASDIPKIRETLSPILAIARQDALMGHEELAQQAQAQLKRILISFSEKFVETCEQQNFPIELALELQRQNLMLGTGVDVWHCAGRKVTADISSQGVNYHFETCTLRGDGEWDLTISGRVSGKGKGSIHTNMTSGEGSWEANDLVFRGERTEAWGDLELVKQDVPEPATTAAVPKVDRSNAQPNGWPQEPPPPVFHPIPQTVTLQTLRVMTILLTGSRGYNGMGAGSWAEGEIRRGEEPCRPGDPYPHSARE